jgi:hypothetical protein
MIVHLFLQATQANYRSCSIHNANIQQRAERCRTMPDTVRAGLDPAPALKNMS